MIALCLLSVLSATRGPITISCPSDIEYEVNPDVDSIAVYWRTPILRNVDDSISVECSLTSGAVFVIGLAEVICDAKSGHVVEATCQFSVNVYSEG